MKTFLTLLLLIPSLGWGLTFKDGKQVSSEEEFLSSITVKNEGRLSINDSKSCKDINDNSNQKYSNESFSFDVDNLLKTRNSFTIYKQHHPITEKPETSSYNEGTRVHAVGDLDNDGNDDVVIIFMETYVAPVILFGKNSREFDIVNLQEISPKLARKNLRKIVLKDIDNDGLKDLIGFTSAEHYPGFDTGEENIFIHNLGNRTFEEIKLPEVRKYDSNHGGFAVDLDNDGLVDIIPLSEGASSHVIKNNKFNKFEIIKKPILNDVSNSWVHDGDGGDLNNDGYNDLVIATEISDNLIQQNKFKTIRVIFGDGDFNFSDNEILKIGENWLTEEDSQLFKKYHGKRLQTGNSNIQLIDINDDGLLDIVQGHYLLDNNGSWSSSGFKVYINKDMNCFIDETDKYFPNQSLNREYEYQFSDFISGFHHKDINNDGYKDLVLRTWNNINRHFFNQEVNPYFFFNIGNKYYLPLASRGANNLKGMSSFVLGDFNGDGLTDIGALHEPNLSLFYVIWGGSSKDEIIERKKEIINKDLLKELDIAIQ